MADVVDRAYPKPFIDPTEPYLVAGYTPHADNEVAQFGRILNRASTGAAYDMPTRVGAPMIGQGGGLYCANDDVSLWRALTVAPTGNTTPSYTVEMEYTDLAAGNRWVVLNGGGGGHGLIKAAGNLYTTFNTGVTVHLVGNYSNRGPHRICYAYSGGFFTTTLNGRLFLGPTATAITASGGVLEIGRDTTIRLVKCSNNPVWSVASDRASYVREFAKNVVWSWQPHDCGEGPASGILTGSTPGGYAVCIDGSATFQHVWRPDLSIPNGGRLCLTETNPNLARRIAISHTRMPVFGALLIKYQVRDPATDAMQIAFTQTPYVDYTGAGSQSYWIHQRQVAGPWWRTSLFYENGAQIDAVDTPSLPVANDRGAILLIHDVDGSWNIYNYLASLRSWYWSAAAPVEVSMLSTNYVVIAPRGAYVEGIWRYQGGMTPHELGVVV